MSGPCVLVTGGCGYIGSHTVTCLLQAKENYSVVVVDNLVNSSNKSLDRVVQIVGLSEEEREERLKFVNVDLLNEEELEKVFVSQQEEKGKGFDSCIHFAGLKAVGESQKIPLRYYENNITGTLILLRLMDKYDCRNIVFSSSATVYGFQETNPITEDAPVGGGITNAYGRTKYMLECILSDYFESKKNDENPWSVILLRYFNPIGSHPSGKSYSYGSRITFYHTMFCFFNNSWDKNTILYFKGLIGEDPFGIPNNLMPYVSQVAVGRREFLTVFGDDYDTVDGTGVRDYLHVMDLAEGHISAIEYCAKAGGLHTFNLGTGNGCSVLEMIKAMEKACGHEIKYKIGARRPGDIATCFADASLAKNEMGWEAKRNLEEMCRDLWCWQSKNPKGYSS